MEFCLVVGHNAGNAVCVQVVFDLSQLPSLGIKLFDRPVKQRSVVGLKMYLAACRQKICVASQKTGCGESVLCITAFRPRVAEVYENALYLGIFEHLTQFESVHFNEADIFYPGITYSFHADDHRICDFFHGKQHRPRILLRCAGGKSALAAAELKPQFVVFGEAFSPCTLELLRVFYLHLRTLFHARDQVRFFSHSHIFVLL